MNTEVMRTFYIINHCRDEPLPGWRHSLHVEFLRRNPTFNITEQNIVDRKNVIVRKRYLTDLQLQEVKREVGQILYQQEEFQNLPDVRAEEEIQPQQRRISRTPSASRSEGRISDVHLPRRQEEHEERRERFLQLVTHYELINPINRPRIPKLRNVNKARGIISSAKSILQQYLDGTNDLQKAHLGLYCASALILELNGEQVYMPNPNRRKKDSDTPMWRKRLEKNIDEHRADADVLNEFLAGNNSRRVMAKTQAIARKAQIDLNNADHRQQLLNLKDLLRQKAKAKGARLRRYNKLTKRKQQNAAFENNQKQFLRSLEKQDEEQPAEIDPARFTTYWNSIWKQYRYLGVCQDGRINHTQLKKECQEKYKSRVTKLLNTLLSGGNLIKAINSWAVPVLTYSFGIVKWSVTDLDELDRLTRRLLTKFRQLHTNSSVIRLYLPRRRGGRGLLNIKNQCLNQEASLRRKILNNRDPLITSVAREDAGYTPLSLGCELIPVDKAVVLQTCNIVRKVLGQDEFPPPRLSLISAGGGDEISSHHCLQQEWKYKSRVTKLLNTLLSGGNLIKAINSWAVPVLTYSFGIVKWSVTDLDELDRLTRRLLTKFRHLHTNSSVIRLYLPRRRGGRGLLNIKNQCLNQEASLRRKLLTNRDPLITAVAREDAGYTPLSLGCELIPVDKWPEGNIVTNLPHCKKGFGIG
ncbi:hypothetical protein NQ318_011770 [Aromia moschata]|uniref:Uncharacterized protein n=1 Tax=Aromia moschata TaxID=1265417 RepID=A0AAV8Y2V1_9CUCU|nr:hypothetical protein NQ318_011770 [Aromia moschata]